MSTSSKSSLKEQNINVFVRIRPFIAQEKAYPSLIDAQSETEIYVKHSNSNKRFKFDRVFDSSCTQKDVYNAIVKPLIPEVIAGYNCTILAYGQTDTGKTYTMTGERGEAEGIIPRALSHIFDELNTSNTQSSVRVSYIELYNEELFDLLAHSERPIRIYEDKNQKGSVILQGIDEYLVTSKKQVYKILEKGSDKRRTASTLMNAHSSRSHIVFTIIVHSRETTSDGEELVKSGKMNLVDLAGCENILRSGAIDKRAREAGNINQSLLTLGRVINALTDRNTHIPYRESKLTRLLQDSLGGRTKTYLIATISSSSLNLEETMSTLDYAMRARNIQNRPEVNQKISRTLLIKQYLDEIERLKRDLAASRTGKGIFLDEDNYKSLMSSTEAQRSELLDKVTTIKTLQSKLDEQSGCMSTIQKSLTNSVGIIESLKHEQLMLTKEKNKQGKELEVFKDKTIYLEGKTMKLYHNQETLHSKLTYLYQLSDTNKSTTKKFNDLYVKLNNELISRVDQCISFVLRSATDASQNIQCNKTILEECYLALKIHLSELSELSSKISKCKHTYFPENKDQEYLSKLESITDNIHKQTFQFLTTLHDECLEGLKEVLNRITNMNFDELITSLGNIRRTAVDASYFISTSLSDFHDVLMCNIESIISNIEAFNSHNINTESAVSSVIEDMTQEFMKIEDQIKDMKEKYLKKLTLAQKEQKHAIQHGSNLLSRMVNFREIIRDRIRAVGNGVVSELDKIKSSVTEPVGLIEILKNKGDEEGILALQLLQQHSNDAKESKKSLTKYFYTSKSHFSEYRKQILDEQRRQTAYYRCIDDHCDNLNSNAKHAFSKLSTLYTNEIGNGKCIDQCMLKTKSEVTIAQEFYQGKSKSILEQVRKFCEAELNYPLRGEDPPRISLPDISYVTGSRKSTQLDREPSFSSSETGLGTTSSSESIGHNYSYDCPDALNGENSDSSFHDLKS